jgi:jasmonate ZIM domain-containing protein
MAHAPRPLPLMPGADDATTAESHEDAEPAPIQMTIVYGGHVLVLDDVTADRAAGLLAAAARQARTAGPIAAAGLPVARKASLQRFMEKRRGRVTARAEPYLHLLHGADRADELTLAL